MTDAGVPLKPFLWFTLFELMKLGASTRPVRVSTNEMARLLGISQQSASRHLRLLEEMGLVSRRIGKNGSLIRISEDGRGKLVEVYYAMRCGLEGAEEELFFEGALFSGMLQGAYYISKPGYRDQIREKLGFDPFPGTLNLRLGEAFLEQRRVLESWPATILEGFRDEERAFGGARCYRVLVNEEVEGALIVANRTSYDQTVMEVISPVNLRRRLELEDGDTVRLLFSGPRRSSS